MTTGRINQVSIVRTRGRAGRRDVTRAVPLAHAAGAAATRRHRLLHRAKRGAYHARRGHYSGCRFATGHASRGVSFPGRKETLGCVCGVGLRTVQRAGRRPKCFTQQRADAVGARRDTWIHLGSLSGGAAAQRTVARRRKGRRAAGMYRVAAFGAG